MLEITREVFRKDPVFKKLFEFIKSKHVVAAHTEKVLRQNRHIKDFCETAVHYMVLPGKPNIYLHYEVGSWYHPEGTQIIFDKIVLYDDYMEYESSRLKGLHSGRESDIPNIN